MKGREQLLLVNYFEDHLSWRFFCVDSNVLEECEIHVCGARLRPLCRVRSFK